MKPYAEMTAEELTKELASLNAKYKKVQALDLSLNMSRDGHDGCSGFQL